MRKQGQVPRADEDRARWTVREREARSPRSIALSSTGSRELLELERLINDAPARYKGVTRLIRYGRSLRSAYEMLDFIPISEPRSVVIRPNGSIKRNRMDDQSLISYAFRNQIKNRSTRYRFLWLLYAFLSHFPRKKEILLLFTFISVSVRLDDCVKLLTFGKQLSIVFIP